MILHPEAPQAIRMLELFSSVGVSAFDLTFTDLAGQKTGFRPGRNLDALNRIMPPLLGEMAAKQHNVIIRPHKNDRALLIQLDDLDHAAAAKISSHSFLMICTSPGNHQAWLAVQDATPDFARRLRKGAGADPTASGATRVSGSLNFKNKYAPAFPLVTITHHNSGHVVTASELEQAGFVTPLEPAPARASDRAFQYRGRRKWPSYERCLQGAPKANGEDKPDTSRADFTWAVTAADWGWGVEDIAARLMELSAKARENGPAYAELTAKNATAAVHRRQGINPPPGPR